ncbi:hypothetical protein HPP92_019624 [Vanilla planifolia]|uniref:Integrase catalytic domain-containing protein n=1 Tax=Vanilla planifolia TaxID=51239 RepID=A0A835ULW8_VANPL|nr:hypothetical protein HPP92_019624 [Vanilla planifolia]
MDFFESFLTAKVGKKFLIAIVDNLSKGINVKPSVIQTTIEALNFLLIDIFNRFGVPLAIVTHNTTIFQAEELLHFYKRYSCQLKYTYVAHNQMNNKAKASNKSLFKILKLHFETEKDAWLIGFQCVGIIEPHFL